MINDQWKVDYINEWYPNVSDVEKNSLILHSDYNTQCAVKYRSKWFWEKIHPNAEKWQHDYTIFINPELETFPAQYTTDGYPITSHDTQEYIDCFSGIDFYSIVAKSFKSGWYRGAKEAIVEVRKHTLILHTQYVAKVAGL